MNKIVFIGPYSKTPMGGVAFVLSEYKKLYNEAKFVASTNSKNNISKILGAICGLIHFVFLLLSKNRIEVVHIHSASNNSFKRKYLFYKIAKQFNKKVIFHVHGGGFHKFYNSASYKLRIKIENTLNNVDCLVCLSRNWESYFTENFNPQSIKIIPNIISSPSIAQNSNLKTGPTTFLFLGLINNNKGIWHLLETISLHKSEITGKAIFHIGGNGETEKLKQLIHDYNLQDIVKFEGWISGNKKTELLQNSDIYILPSYNEGLPISILEAMSYSMPILSTTVGGIPEVVDDSNGILTEPGNKEQLWESIQHLLSKTKEELSEMGLNSNKKVKPHLPSSVKIELDNLYQTL